MILQWDESFDIGSDTLTGVNDADYQPPFTLTAKLNKLTIKVDRPQLTAEDIEKLEGEAEATAVMASRCHHVQGRATVARSRLTLFQVSESRGPLPLQEAAAS